MHSRDLPILGNCALLLFLVCSGCAAGANAATGAANTDATHCFVLPGAGSGATKSYRVVEGGGLVEAGEVSGGAMHVRAAFHPDGRTLYVSSVGPAGWEPWDGRGTWEEGIHVRAYAYEPADCSIGGLLGTGRMGSDAPVIERAYGLLVHSNGRYLYQTTNSIQRIRLFDLPEDRVPVPRAEFDVTAGGEHVCVQIRRLSMHPSRPYLYANCNNGDGVEDALQVWAVERDGAIGLIGHYTFPAMNGGVLDPVVHPSGDWLYQPVGTASIDAPADIGAYVLIYRVAEHGMLTLHDRLPVRTIPPDSLAESTHVSTLPMNILLHPDGGTAYVQVHSQVVELDSTGYAASDTGSEHFRHGFAIHTIEDGGARLVERAWLPALRETVYSTHHGATLATFGGDLFMYSYLTDYDTIQGGVLQRLRVTDEHSLEALDPPWLPTGLIDGRQPIAMPGSGSPAETPPDTSNVILMHPDHMVSPSPDGELLAYVDWSTGDLAIRDLDSGDVGHLTANPAPYEDGFANSPRYAPDGERVAFTWWNAATGRAELRVVSIDPAGLEAMGPPRTIRRMDYGWIEAKAWTPDGARIVAWTISEEGDNRILLVSPDDGRTDVVRSFEWRVPLSVHQHPGGRYLAFDYQTAAGDFTRDIRLLDLEKDHEIELVTHPANDYVFGWSPDGRRLLFASDRSGSVDLWALAFDAGGAAGPPRLIREGLGPVAPVEITASGQLFYAAVNGGQDVFVGHLDPETRTIPEPAEPVPGSDGAERLSPDWSPDGQRLAWVHNVGPRPRATGHQAIAVRTIETGETPLISLAPRLSHLGTPRWIDPDRLVLSARDEPSNTVRLYVLDTRSGEASLLVQPDSGAAIEEPVPGPRGRTLYYKENRENPDGERVQRVVRRDLRSGEEATLFSTASGEGAGWRLQRLALSPDGERLALTLQRRGAPERLVVVPARGGPSERVRGFPGGGHVTLAWSADGRTIWFTRRADGADDGEPSWELWWIDPATSAHEAAGLVQEGLAGLTFDPSGTRIGFTAGRRRYEIRAAPLSFGAPAEVIP